MSLSMAGSHEQAPAQPLPRVQKPRTCLPCRQSKTRCNKGSPCDRCIRLDLICQPQTRNRGRPLKLHKRRSEIIAEQLQQARQQQSQRFGTALELSGDGATEGAPGYAVPHSPNDMDGSLELRVAHEALAVGVYMLKTRGLLTGPRLLAITKTWSAENYRRGVDITRGLIKYLLELLPQPPCSAVGPVEPNASQEEIEHVREGHEQVALPKFVERLDDGVSAFCGYWFYRGQFVHFANESFERLYMEQTEMNDRFHELAVVPSVVWAKAVAPEDHAEFYTSIIAYTFAPPQKGKEMSMLVHSVDRFGCRRLCLARVRYVIFDDGLYSSLVLALTPMPGQPSHYPTQTQQLQVGAVADGMEVQTGPSTRDSVGNLTVKLDEDMLPSSSPSMSGGGFSRVDGWQACVVDTPRQADGVLPRSGSGSGNAGGPPRPVRQDTVSSTATSTDGGNDLMEGGGGDGMNAQGLSSAETSMLFDAFGDGGNQSYGHMTGEERVGVQTYGQSQSTHGSPTSAAAAAVTEQQLQRSSSYSHLNRPVNTHAHTAAWPPLPQHTQPPAPTSVQTQSYTQDYTRATYPQQHYQPSLRYGGNALSRRYGALSPVSANSSPLGGQNNTLPPARFTDALASSYYPCMPPALSQGITSSSVASLSAMASMVGDPDNSIGMTGGSMISTYGDTAAPQSQQQHHGGPILARQKGSLPSGSGGWGPASARSGTVEASWLDDVFREGVYHEQNV